MQELVKSVCRKKRLHSLTFSNMKFFRIKPDNIKSDHHEIQQSVEALDNDRLIVIPTDTVYGLTCNALSKKAVKRVYDTKRRRHTEPLPVFFYSPNHAKEFLKIDRPKEKFLEKVWPGKVTVVLPLRNNRLDEDGLSEACAGFSTCGARAPDYELVKILISEFDRPIVGTSANIAGLEPSVKLEEILSQFESKAERPDIVLDAGVLPESEPSTVVEPTKEGLKIIRDGAVPAAKLEEIWEDIHGL